MLPMIFVLLNILLAKDTKKPEAKIISLNGVRSLNLNLHFFVSVLWITFLSLRAVYELESLSTSKF